MNNVERALMETVEELASTVAAIQTDNAAVFRWLSEYLPNLSEDQRQALDDEAQRRLDLSRQIKLNAQNLLAQARVNQPLIQ